MTVNNTARRLRSLAQLDADAWHAYGKAIEQIDSVGIRAELTQFQADHDRHYRELCDAIQALGDKPPDFTPDIKGFLIEGFTALRSLTGTEGALNAMETNERLTTKTYEDARSWELPEQYQALIERNYADEQLHLTFIRQALASRSWEK